MSDRLTADKLVELIEASPDNHMSNGVSITRSGRRLIVHSHVDVEKLTARINEWFEGQEGARA